MKIDHVKYTKRGGGGETWYLYPGHHGIINPSRPRVELVEVVKRKGKVCLSFYANSQHVCIDAYGIALLRKIKQCLDEALNE